MYSYAKFCLLNNLTIKLNNSLQIADYKRMTPWKKIFAIVSRIKPKIFVILNVIASFFFLNGLMKKQNCMYIQSQNIKENRIPVQRKKFMNMRRNKTDSLLFCIIVQRVQEIFYANPGY